MKRVLAAALTFSMALSLAACGGGAPAGSSGSNGKSGGTEYPVITMTFQKGFSTGESEEAVEDALNEIFREKVGAEIDITLLEMSNFATTLNLMLTGGDDAPDIFTSSLYKPMATLQANGQLMDITDYMAYAPGITSYFEQYEGILDCGMVDGRLYGLPNITTWSTPNNLIVKKADADNAGLDFSSLSMSNMDELTDVLLKLKEANPNSYYIPGSQMEYFVPKSIDNLSDSKYLGVVMDPTNDTTVENFFETEYFENWLENVKVWKENGIIIPDPMSNTNGTLTDLREGKVNGTTGYSWSVDEFTYEANLSQEYGDSLVGVQMGDRLITTGNVSTFLWHVSAWCKHPDKAVAMLDLMFTDPQVAQIISCGIEGSDYVMDENGQINYPEGKSSTTVGWPISTQGMFPNCFMNPSWYYQPTDVYTQMEKSNQEAEKSKALGFVFNIDEVAGEYAQCSNVVDQYYLSLINGAASWEETLPAFRQALKDAGVSRIIEAKQAQLDSWLASKG